MLYRTSKLNVFEKIAKSDLAAQHPYTIVKALGGKTRHSSFSAFDSINPFNAESPRQAGQT
jgi:hypothetical protein